MEKNTNITMTARILKADCCELLVCDQCTNQEVIVHTDKGCCFSRGECVCIHYNGAMTASIPPQISAHCIHRRPCHCCCQTKDRD